MSDIKGTPDQNRQEAHHKPARYAFHHEVPSGRRLRRGMWEDASAQSGLNVGEPPFFEYRQCSVVNKRNTLNTRSVDDL